MEISVPNDLFLSCALLTTALISFLVMIPLSYNYLLNNRVISGTTSTKYLGIIINQKLNWNQHCDYICSKANGTLGLLRRVLCDCNRDVKSKAYTTLVRPKLEYASFTWNPRTKRNINQIEMVQHRGDS